MAGPASLECILAEIESSLDAMEADLHSVSSNLSSVRVASPARRDVTDHRMVRPPGQGSPAKCSISSKRRAPECHTIAPTLYDVNDVKTNDASLLRVKGGAMGRAPRFHLPRSLTDANDVDHELVPLSYDAYQVTRPRSQSAFIAPPTKKSPLPTEETPLVGPGSYTPILVEKHVSCPKWRAYSPTDANSNDTTNNLHPIPIHSDRMSDDEGGYDSDHLLDAHRYVKPSIPAFSFGRSRSLSLPVNECSSPLANDLAQEGDSSGALLLPPVLLDGAVRKRVPVARLLSRPLSPRSVKIQQCMERKLRQKDGGAYAWVDQWMAEYDERRQLRQERRRQVNYRAIEPSIYSVKMAPPPTASSNRNVGKSKSKSKGKGWYPPQKREHWQFYETLQADRCVRRRVTAVPFAKAGLRG
jgi:hypothetical protein